MAQKRLNQEGWMPHSDDRTAEWGKNAETSFVPLEEVNEEHIRVQLPISVHIEVMDPWDRLGPAFDLDIAYYGGPQLALLPRNFRPNPRHNQKQ